MIHQPRAGCLYLFRCQTAEVLVLVGSDKHGSYDRPVLHAPDVLRQAFQPSFLIHYQEQATTDMMHLDVTTNKLLHCALFAECLLCAKMKDEKPKYWNLKTINLAMLLFSRLG